MKELTKEQCKERMVNILVYFHNFCTNNDLKYSIWFGTAIGAVRHGGFIPWDDDIDVVMPRGDYEKLLSLHKDNEAFVLYDDRKKGFNIPYSKLCDATTTSKSLMSFDEVGVFIDIFPFDLVDLNDKKIHKIINHLKKMRFANLKKGPLVFPDYKKANKKFVTLRKLLFFIRHEAIPLNRFFSFYNSRKKQIKKIINKMERKEYSIIGVSPNTKPFFDKYVFDNMETIIFENIKVNIIKDYDKYLRLLYGDYMIIPKDSDKRQHCYYSFFVK